MIFSIDFDGTIVEQDRQYEDVTTPLKFIEGAEEALRSLKYAGHILVVVSARANLAHRKDWRLNPLWVQKIVPFDVRRWERQQPINELRYQQMVAFCSDKLSGVIDVVDDGYQGKFASIDYFIDDRAIAFSNDWWHIARLYGEPAESAIISKKV